MANDLASLMGIHGAYGLQQAEMQRFVERMASQQQRAAYTQAEYEAEKRKAGERMNKPDDRLLLLDEEV